MEQDEGLGLGEELESKTNEWKRSPPTMLSMSALYIDPTPNGPDWLHATVSPQTPFGASPRNFFSSQKIQYILHLTLKSTSLAQFSFRICSANVLDSTRSRVDRVWAIRAMTRKPGLLICKLVANPSQKKKDEGRLGIPHSHRYH